MILSGRRFPKEDLVHPDRFFKAFGNGWIDDTTFSNKETYYNMYSRGDIVRSFNLSDFLPMNNINLDNIEFTVENEGYEKQYNLVVFARTVDSTIDQGTYTYNSIIEVMDSLYKWRGVV